MDEKKARQGLWRATVAALALAVLVPSCALFDRPDEARIIDQETRKLLAIRINGEVWRLLAKRPRTADEESRMVHAAHASLYHWATAGKLVNVQRGEWLTSRVYAVLKRPGPALHHAKQCLELTRKHNIGDFDLAYAYEGMARALAAAGKHAECKTYQGLARQAGDKIKGKGNRELFFSDFRAGPWFGVK